MLYDKIARKDGSTLVSKSVPLDDDDEPFSIGFMTANQPRMKHKKRRVSRETVEYGPYIPTLTKLLESGHFE